MYFCLFLTRTVGQLVMPTLFRHERWLIDAFSYNTPSFTKTISAIGDLLRNTDEDGSTSGCDKDKQYNNTSKSKGPFREKKTLVVLDGYEENRVYRSMLDGLL